MSDCKASFCNFTKNLCIVTLRATRLREPPRSPRKQNNLEGHDLRVKCHQGVPEHGIFINDFADITWNNYRECSSFLELARWESSNSCYPRLRIKYEQDRLYLGLLKRSPLNIHLSSSLQSSFSVPNAPIRFVTWRDSSPL